MRFLDVSFEWTVSSIRWIELSVLLIVNNHIWFEFRNNYIITGRVPSVVVKPLISLKSKRSIKPFRTERVCLMMELWHQVTGQLLSTCVLSNVAWLPHNLHFIWHLFPPVAKRGEIVDCGPNGKTQYSPGKVIGDRLPNKIYVLKFNQFSIK